MPIAIIEKVLSDCGAGIRGDVKALAKQIVSLGGKHGLECQNFGGKPCKSGLDGHILQIFVRADIADKIAYAAKPYGVPDKKRHPIGPHLQESAGPIQGQARLVMHPSFFHGQETCSIIHCECR